MSPTTATLFRFIPAAIAVMAAAMFDTIVIVNTFGRATLVRLTTATISLVTALIGRVRATIGPSTVIITLLRASAPLAFWLRPETELNLIKRGDGWRWLWTLGHC